jgi:hypothetical protein
MTRKRRTPRHIERRRAQRRALLADMATGCALFAMGIAALAVPFVIVAISH